MRSFLAIIGLIAPLAAFAAHLSPTSRVLLADAKAPASRADAEPSPFVPLIMLVDDDFPLSDLEDLGVIVYHSRDNMLLTSVPRQVLDTVLAMPLILEAETAGPLSLSMDLARPFGHVDVAQTMTDSHLLPFDGSGVITGFSDIGFDSEHIAFAGRVSAAYQYDAAQGVAVKAQTPDQLKRWHTDDPEKWHATHVANILAGGFLASRYHGVATGSEIAAATSRLTDVGILSGVEDIIAYAKSCGKPAVINLSLGSSLGPHDGTSLICRYLSACSSDAIICLSAGNTAIARGYAYKYIETPGEITRFTVDNRSTWTGLDVNGMTEVWSDSHHPIDMRVEVIDRDSKALVYASEWLSQQDVHPDSLMMTVDFRDEPWCSFFKGSVLVAGGVSALNDRYCVSAAYDAHTSERAESNPAVSRYTLALAFRTDSRALVDIFADSSTSMITQSAVAEGSPVFSIEGTISDLCTAPGVIAVGSCNSRNTAPALYQHQQSWNFEVGRVTEQSSCSSRPNMPRLPHICAPGHYVVSAMSSYYVQQSTEEIPHLAAVSLVGDKYYYWSAECGTSMASPYVAGVIALWLQANPNLTSAEVIEIMQSTARTDFPNITDVRWGAGCIDAEAGLKMVLSHMASLSPEVPVAAQGSRKVYNLSGYEVDDSKPLSPGIYIVKLPNLSTEKIIIH